MPLVQPVYMIVIKNLDTQQMYFYTSGRRSTPFSTFNLGRARAEVTKMLKSSLNRHYTIVKILNQDGTFLVTSEQIQG